MDFVVIFICRWGIGSIEGYIICLGYSLGDGERVKFRAFDFIIS